jgi:hypothetical protein
VKERELLSKVLQLIVATMRWPLPAEKADAAEHEHQPVIKHQFHVLQALWTQLSIAVPC